MTHNQIRALRRERGLTLEELAAKIPTPPNNLKVGKATLSKLELGQRQLTPEWAAVIAKALDVCANDLTGGAATPQGVAPMNGQLLALMLGALLVLLMAAPFLWFGILPPSREGGSRVSPPRAAGRRW